MATKAKQRSAASAKKNYSGNNNQYKNFSKPYNKNNRIKANNYQPPVKQSIADEKLKKIGELNKEIKQALPDIERSMNEVYAQDLLMLAILHNMLSSNTKVQEHIDKLQQDQEKGLIADKNWKHNLDTMNEFKTQYKYLKILEVKAKEQSIKPEDLTKIEELKQKAKEKLNQLAQRFDFDDGMTKLKFNNLKEAEIFLDEIEKELLENSYRMDIDSPAEIVAIAKSDIRGLYTLAQETKDQKNQLNQGKMDSKVEQALEVVGTLTSTVSPTAATLKR